MTSAGYSGTPLIKKLGLKPEMRIALRNPPTIYLDALGMFSGSSSWVDEADFIHIFVRSQDELQQYFPPAKAILHPNGLLWVSWIKKSAKIPTDLDENIIREFGLAQGLVDVKVAAIDVVWSGLKFVYRLADR